MMLRWISLVPPGIVPANERRYDGDPRALTLHSRPPLGVVERAHALGVDTREQDLLDRLAPEQLQQASAPAQPRPLRNFEKPRYPMSMSACEST